MKEEFNKTMAKNSSTKNEKLSQPVTSKRLLSIDALRGFDMFWIMGAEGIFAALFALTGIAIFDNFASQMLHSTWHGITAYDLIFPLFIFLSGVSIGIAAKPIDSYTSSEQSTKYKHAFKRLILLLALGVVYNHGWGNGIPASVDDIRYASVLGRIGIAWFVAIMLVWHFSTKQQWWLSVGILFTYWMLLEFVEISGFGGGNYSANYSLNVWVDQNFLPGITYRNAPMDPEGILSNIPSIVNAMAGVFAGRLMKKQQHSALKLITYLVAAGLGCLALGYGWGLFMPINKSLWTSSFVLVTSGYSLLLLAFFYWLIDVLKWQFWAKIFAVIGMNSIVIYLSGSLIDWKYSASSLFGGIISYLPHDWVALCSVLSIVTLQWFFLYWLYRQKLFIKV